MAIESLLYCSTTDSIVLPAKRKFFPADIPIPHPQLRHYISTADKDWIYFATVYDIYLFHIPTQRKRLLITLPFTPRCLTAGLGWICAGGEANGDCAFIKLRKRNGSYMDVDASLPLQSDSLSSKSYSAGAENIDIADIRPELVLEQFGGDIVNSITIHALAQESPDDPPEPIAVISNNDRTVKLFSLSRRQQITELMHSNCMNYATISPDSQTLVAVGDENKVYFYRREVIRSQVAFFDGKRFTNHRWRLFAKPHLPSDGTATNDCCFSAVFSPASHLCAVAAQNGLISVFDMNVLKNLSPGESPASSRLCTFRSSRPRGFATGAVRSMAFSPQPWDLLLWAEEFGRAGVADVREAFMRRQIIKLETHSPEMERIIPEDLTDPQLRALDPETRMLHQFRESIGFDDEDTATRNQWLRRGVSRHRHEQLTERERQLIESVETSRPNENNDILDSLLGPAPQPPYSVNYTSSPRVRASLAHGDRSARLQAMMNQFVRTLAPDQSDDQPYTPRRRGSVLLSQSNQSTDRLVPDPRIRITRSPSRLPGSNIDGDDSRPHSVSVTLEASGAFASDEPGDDPLIGPGSDNADLLALFQRHQSDLPIIERQIARQQSELPDLEQRIMEQQRQLEQLQREMAARINASPRLSSSRMLSIEGLRGDANFDPTTYLDMARALEPFDATGIPPEDLDAEREQYDRRADAAREHARLVRHVLFAGDNPTAQSSALPTTNLTSNGQSMLSSISARTAGIRQLLRERDPSITSSRESAVTRRPSTPSNPQSNRNRSQSPTSRALASARSPVSIPPATTRVADVLNPSMNHNDHTIRALEEFGRPSDSSTTTRRPRTSSSASIARQLNLSHSIRSARRMAIENQASRMMDANGNWMAGEALATSSLRPTDSVRETRGGGDSWAERGVGTAGVGWSWDGRYLFIGTEEGIFQYAINLHDRMTFPSFSFQ